MEYSLIEYRVKPVTRYVVTRYHQGQYADGGNFGGCEGRGEFDNYDTAHAVAYALAKAEHDAHGWPEDDMRIQYPKDERGAQVA